jgi:hypothetical protein
MLVVPVLIFSVILYLPILRLNTIFTYGSSGFARLIQPINSVINLLSKYPIFGSGLGQIGLYNPVLDSDNYIFNGIAVMIYSFGLSVIFFFVPILNYVFNVIRINPASKIFFISLFLTLFSTGEVFGLNLITIFLLFAISISIKRINLVKIST